MTHGSCGALECRCAESGSKMTWTVRLCRAGIWSQAALSRSSSRDVGGGLCLGCAVQELLSTCVLGISEKLSL